MACSFIASDSDQSFMENLELLRTPNKQDRQVYEFEMEKQKEQTVIELPRGGTLIKTSIGNIQFGFPPETVKDSINMKLQVPTHFIVPTQRFDKQANLNVAEFEFPAYFNFFIHKKKINLICDEQSKSAIRNAFQETLCGPTTFDKLQDDFHFSFPKSGIPDFKKERALLSGSIEDPSMHTEVDHLLSFTIFDKDDAVELKDESKKSLIRIEKKAKNEHESFFRIIDNGIEIASIPDKVILGSNKDIKIDRNSSLDDLDEVLKEI